AAGAAHRPGGGRPQPGVRVPADRGVRMSETTAPQAAHDGVTAGPRRTPLHAEHVALGATTTEFAGWDMPLRYTSDRAEHEAVRTAAGLFDLSHMGEVRVRGAGAGRALDRALVGSLSDLAVGRARYTMACRDDGGVLDDLIVYRTADEDFLDRKSVV